MTRRDQLRENVEDAVFALLMEDVAEQEGKRLIEENEQLKQDPSAKVPDALDKRCRQIIKRSYAKERRHEVGRAIHHVLGNVALAAMVCILLFVSAFAAVPKIRVITLNLLIEVSDVSTSLRLTGTDNEPAAQNGDSDDADGVKTLWGYRLPEMPDGYDVEYEDVTEHGAELWYGDGNGKMLMFNVDEASESFDVSVDTEDAEVEAIQIHGYNGLLAVKENRIEIIWGDTTRNRFVSIICIGVDRSTAFGLAKEIEYLG